MKDLYALISIDEDDGSPFLCGIYPDNEGAKRAQKYYQDRYGFGQFTIEKSQVRYHSQHKKGRAIILVNTDKRI